MMSSRKHLQTQIQTDGESSSTSLAFTAVFHKSTQEEKRNDDSYPANPAHSKHQKRDNTNQTRTLPSTYTTLPPRHSSIKQHYAHSPKLLPSMTVKGSHSPCPCAL